MLTFKYKITNYLFLQAINTWFLFYFQCVNKIFIKAFQVFINKVLRSSLELNLHWISTGFSHLFFLFLSRWFRYRLWFLSNTLELLNQFNKSYQMSHKNEIDIGLYNKVIIVTVKCSSTVSDIHVFWVRIMTYTTSSSFTSIQVLQSRCANNFKLFPIITTRNIC